MVRPTFGWRCKECDYSHENHSRYCDDPCPNCGGRMRRDWQAEGMNHNFHPTVDVYYNSKKKKGLKIGEQ